jgi:hypothetical protein
MADILRGGSLYVLKKPSKKVERFASDLPASYKESHEAQSRAKTGMKYFSDFYIS